MTWILLSATYSGQRDISTSLRYLDICKKASRNISPALESLVSRLTRSGTTLKYISHRADAILKNLKFSFNAGKMRTSLRLAEDLLTLSSIQEDLYRHRISAYHYLSLIHTALGRHDRACSAVAMMVRLSKSTGDAVLLSRALVTLGKVHLSCGHLEAAARAWENLSIHIEHPVLRAWTLHEIGRCHLETGKYVEALRKAMQCRECADEANSKKWTFHAGLLRAQCLVMLGRFAGDDSISQTVAPSFSSKKASPRSFSWAKFFAGRVFRTSKNAGCTTAESRHFLAEFQRSFLIFNFFRIFFHPKYNITLHLSHYF